MSKQYKLGWFSTGRGEGSRNLLRAVHDSIARGEVKAEFAFVFVNRVKGEHAGTDEFIKLVESYKLPLICVSSSKYRQKYGDDWRPKFEDEVMQKLAAYQFDLGVLAGYMLICGDKMCTRYNLLNLHPAKPGGPKGTWKEVIWQLMETKAQETGAMMHLATPELDRGPAVTYCAFSIRGKPFDQHWSDIAGLSISEVQKHDGENNPLFMAIRKHGAARELPLIISTIKAFSEGKVRIEGGKIIDSKGKIITAYDLTQDVDKAVKDILTT
jgi:phosphoribosylglycinamide formyltransferase-1